MKRNAVPRAARFAAALAFLLLTTTSAYPAQDPAAAPTGEAGAAEPSPDATLDTSLGTGPAAEDFAAGMAAVEAGDPAAAVDRLEAALRADPDNLRFGAEYRQAVIATQQYDRALELFEELAGANPDSTAIHLNWGYAYVDKIPDAGAVTQVILANTALKRFSEALEIEETWLGLYTRGNSYVYWPVVFGRAQLGIADLEKAVSWSQRMGDQAPGYHSNAYAALGDAHWRLGDREAAQSWWDRGVKRFPGSSRLQPRTSLEGDELEAFIEAHYAIGERVGTDLRDLWKEE